MKNLKVYLSTFSLVGALVFLSGCSQSEGKVAEDKQEECTHMIVNIGDEPCIFKECEGYGIHTSNNYGLISFTIEEGNKNILQGESTNATVYTAFHDKLEPIDEKATENGAYVYKLQK